MRFLFWALLIYSIVRIIKRIKVQTKQTRKNGRVVEDADFEIVDDDEKKTD